MTLYQAASELHRTGATSKSIAGDTLSGRVRNLKQSAAIGGLSGPAFEARVEADEGDCVVRYLLTGEGQAQAKRTERARAPLLN